MKKYRIIKPIILSFLSPQDQHDIIIEPENETILESDGHTIWIIKNGKRHESITTANAIEYYLNDGTITEICSEEEGR